MLDYLFGFLKGLAKSRPLANTNLANGSVVSDFFLTEAVFLTGEYFVDAFIGAGEYDVDAFLAAFGAIFAAAGPRLVVGET